MTVGDQVLVAVALVSSVVNVIVLRAMLRRTRQAERRAITAANYALAAEARVLAIARVAVGRRRGEASN